MKIYKDNKYFKKEMAFGILFSKSIGVIRIGNLIIEIYNREPNRWVF